MAGISDIQGESVISIRNRLFSMADPVYRDFLVRLIPSIDPEKILGVRAPALRALAKELQATKEASGFFADLPHIYQEENALHGYLLAFERNSSRCLALINDFLPFVDNWAVCDGISPPCFKKHRSMLLQAIPCWLSSGRTYTIRFGIKMLMDHFLDENFSPDCLTLAASVCSNAYYVNMMIAWYFATALAKQWEATLPWLEERRLDQWVHNKTIQKAIESYRISNEQKTVLRALRWK